MRGASGQVREGGRQLGVPSLPSTRRQGGPQAGCRVFRGIGSAKSPYSGGWECGGISGGAGQAGSGVGRWTGGPGQGVLRGWILGSFCGFLSLGLSCAEHMCAVVHDSLRPQESPVMGAAPCSFLQLLADELPEPPGVSATPSETDPKEGSGSRAP